MLEYFNQEEALEKPDERDPTVHLEEILQEFAKVSSVKSSTESEVIDIELPEEGRTNESSPERPYHNPVYEALTGRYKIRLLHLSTSSSGDGQVIHGPLIQAQLADRPEFTALSYTWADLAGDRSLRGTLFLGPEWAALPITTNCAAALRCLRSRPDAGTVWVDAICINQDDTSERSQQVVLMRDIYSRARKVIIFLGDDGDQQTCEGQPAKSISMQGTRYESRGCGFVMVRRFRRYSAGHIGVGCGSSKRFCCRRRQSLCWAEARSRCLAY